MTLTRAELTFKWSLYGLTALLFFLIQGLFLRRLTFWGVMPFLYPLAAVIPATYENSFSGIVFSLCAGMVCDWLLPGSVPCLHTLAFPLAGCIAGYISRRALPAGLLCSLLAAGIVFALLGAFHCLHLAAIGRAAWTDAMWTQIREFLITLPWVLPVSFLFQCVKDRVRLME